MYRTRATLDQDQRVAHRRSQATATYDRSAKLLPGLTVHS